MFAPQPVKTPTQIAALFGVPEVLARAQLLSNAKQMREFEATARRIGSAHRGKTAEQWGERAVAFEEAARS